MVDGFVGSNLLLLQYTMRQFIWNRNRSKKKLLEWLDFIVWRG
jgi:hypothetical protein